MKATTFISRWQWELQSPSPQAVAGGLTRKFCRLCHLLAVQKQRNSGMFLYFFVFSVTKGYTAETFPAAANEACKSVNSLPFDRKHRFFHLFS